MSTTASHPMDKFTADLFAALFTVKNDEVPSDEERGAVAELFGQAEGGNLTGSHRRPFCRAGPIS
jgi:hypothetical protein